MTDYEVLLEGAGFVALSLDEQGLPRAGAECGHIMVFASGAVLFRDDGGGTHASHLTRCHVSMKETPRWSMLDELARVTSAQSEPEPLPSCPRCEDNVTKIATMIPPVCPSCGKTANV